MKGLYVGVGKGLFMTSFVVGEWYECEINYNNPHCYNIYDDRGYYRMVLKTGIKTLEQVRDERLKLLGL
jgi:hypothetical protein